MFPVRANGETIRETTMPPQQCFVVCGGFNGKESHPVNLLATFSYPKIPADLSSYPKRHVLSIWKEKALIFLTLRKFEATFY